MIYQNKLFKKITIFSTLLFIVVYCLLNPFWFSQPIILIICLVGIIYVFKKIGLSFDSGIDKLNQENAKTEQVKKSFWQRNWPYILALAIITVIGTLLRLYNLDYQNLYTDESTSYMVAQQILEQGSTDYPRARLFSYLTAWGVDIFGDNNAFALRIAAVAIGSISIPITYWATNALARNKNIALFAAFLLSINAWHIAMSRAARMYILFALLFAVILTLVIKYGQQFFLYKKLSQFLKDYWLRLVVLIGIYWLSFDTHSASLEILIFMMVLGLFYLYQLYFKDIKRFKKYLYYILGLTLALVIAVIVFPKLSNKLSYFNLLTSPNWRYVQLVFKGSILSYLVVLIFIFMPKKTWPSFAKADKYNIFAVIGLGIVAALILRTFFIDHYISKRYIFHLAIPTLILAAYVTYLFFLGLKKQWKWIFLITAIIVSVVYNGLILNRIYNTKSGHIFIGTYAENYQDAVKAVDIDKDDGLLGTARNMLVFHQSENTNVHNYCYQMWENDIWVFYNWKNSRDQYKDFIKYVSKYDHGYYFADHRRFYKWKTKVPWETKLYILENMKKVSTSSEDVDVYEWGSKN